METKKNFFNYIKNSYSNTTNFSNFKILRVFYCLALLLTLLFIPTVNAQALELPPGFRYTPSELPFDIIQDKYYVIVGKFSDKSYHYEEIFVSDTPFYMIRGDHETQVNNQVGNVFMTSYMYLTTEEGKYSIDYDIYQYKNNNWVKGKDPVEINGNPLDIVSWNYSYIQDGKKNYLTNQDIDGNFNFEGTDIGFFKNDEWVQYPQEEKPEDTGTKFEKIDIPFNLIKDKYYFMFSLGSTDSPYYYVLTADSPIYMKLGDSDYHDPVYDDDMNPEWYYPTISPDTFDSKVSCYRLAPYDDDWTIAFKEFYFRDVEWNLYDSIYNQKKYLTNHDVTFVNGNYYSQGFNAPKNDNEVSYPYQPSLPGEEEPPVEETPTVGNESYIIINGEKVSVNYAIVQYLMRIEFIITLLFTVTVVLFIINKFWAWCRRLFTTSIR